MSAEDPEICREHEDSLAAAASDLGMPSAADTAEATRVGGELNAAVTSALVGIHTKYLGRGPQRAWTFYRGNVMVTLMYGVLTHAEKALNRTHQGEAVNQMRHLFQETMETDFREAVERLTGRKVAAFISGTNLEPDVAAEVFVLDESL